MKTVFKSFSVFAIFLFLFSCDESKEEANQRLRAEVIQIHDEVMPFMGDLKSLRKEIVAKADELKSSSESDNTQKVQELILLAKQLDEAFDGMFVWMRQFKQSTDDMSEEEVEIYLLEQREMVQKVHDDITSAIEKANSELGKY
ncbi:hypothetical protein SAMN06295967_11523 [Belliella buryatensis]|uniref:Viral A-type inclusion protein n=1 Tax=Belliella buryatensis TaxID=1500549 RepID=A0A239G798_9BACT|nr:hypothetical protein [Belliella buryatensis]SNS64989.1 hypothetical protein SAMN06295967_11523 [Belliella buryatensis]